MNVVNFTKHNEKKIPTFKNSFAFFARGKEYSQATTTLRVLLYAFINMWSAAARVGYDTISAMEVTRETP